MEYRCVVGHELDLSESDLRGDGDDSFPKIGYAVCPDCGDRTKRVLKPKAWKSRFSTNEGDDDDD